MGKTPLSSIVLALFVAAGLRGQTPDPSAALSWTDRAIESLRQVSGELNQAVKGFYVHLDREIARHDHGYRAQNGQFLEAADTDLNSGPADLMWTATRRLAAFRMLYSRKPGYAPDILAELDRIQNLIAEARKRVDASIATPHRLLLVSVAELNPRMDAVLKVRHNLLLRTRAAAEDAAVQALLALPIEQPGADSQNRSAHQVWDALGRGSPIREDPVQPVSLRIPELNPAAEPRRAVEIPIRPIRRKRVTLIDEISYRMAATDSGMEDQRGRRLFYQEEWVQRGAAVIRYRWRVALDTYTGEHILLKRYAPLQLHGSLDDLYSRPDRNYLWYLEPPEDASEPTSREIESALSNVARSREAIRIAGLAFRSGIREALAQQDDSHAAAGEPVVDGGLADNMRQTLFAIRAHLARVPAILELEQNVRRSVGVAEMAVQDLEPLAAWANRTPKAAWALHLDRSDREIDSVRSAESEALAFLPPDSSRSEDSFPAIEKNVIIRIRRAPLRNPRNGQVKCLEEIWRMESGVPGTRQVRRVVSLIQIDPRTGVQTRAGVATTFYKASPGDLLEEIFDEYAADDVSLGG
jgi:hypothetical protein